MELGELRNQITSIYSKIINPLNAAIDLSKIDIEYLNPLDFKPNDLGFMVNNWVRLSNRQVDFGTNKNSLSKTLATGSKLYLNDIISEGEYLNKKLGLVESKYLDVLIFNVLIDVKRTPTIAEYPLRGKGNSVKVYLADNDFDITISGTFAGSVSWQTDTLSIKNLIELVGLGDSMFIQNPMLNHTYDIDKVVVYSYSISDNPRFQSLKDFTITLKSDGVAAYVDLEFNPFTEGVSQNDVSVGYIVKTPPFAATVRAFGCTDAVSTKRLEVYELAGKSFVFVNCSNFTANTNDVSTGNVLLAGKRSNGTDETAVINASEVTVADASTGVPNHNAFELISNDNGTPYPADFDTQPHLFSWHGTSAVDTAPLKSTIDALEIALAAL